MANQKVTERSISLPARLPSSNNPINFQAQLENLSSWKSKASPISSEAIQSGLIGLAQLYTSVQELSTSKSSFFAQDESVELIDSCSSIREMIQMINENVRSLQSAIRRKGLESSTIQDDVHSYLSFRKKMNKNISKSLKAIRNLENKKSSNADEVMEVTTAVLRGILMYLSCPVMKSGKWSLISKLMTTKSEASARDQCVTSEAAELDLALAAKFVDAQRVQKGFVDVDSCIQEIELGLEKLYRQLIQCRVTSLNILIEY